MSTITSTFPISNNSLLRLSVIGGLITGALHVIIQAFGMFVLVVKASTFMIAMQYVASGLLGDAAYAGGFYS